MLGCAPAHVLFEEIVKVEKKDGVEAPRSFSEYTVSVSRDRVPTGVELLELPRDMQRL
jgi:CRISPR-associated protein Csd2